MKDYMLSSKEIRKVVDNLIGNINPVGETYADNDAYERQDVAEFLVDTYLGYMMGIARDKDRAEYSISRAGKKAYKYFKDLKNWIDECLDDIDNQPDYPEC